jgi:hypothetical protein
MKEPHGEEVLFFKTSLAWEYRVASRPNSGYDLFGTFFSSWLSECNKFLTSAHVIIFVVVSEDRIIG